MNPSASHLDPAELAALMHFYADAGVEWMLEDAPVDRIAEFAEQQAAWANRAPQQAPGQQAPVQQDRQQQTGDAPSPQGKVLPGRASPPPRPSSTPVAIPDDQAIAAARLAADSARSLDELKTAMEAFGSCNLKHGARSTVFASGNPASGIMVIGPMPNADDDRDGMPFSGRQGQMLDRMLAAIGLSRETVLLANTVPWRPPGNRTPSPVEMEICRPFIERQIALVEPKLMLLLGNFTAKCLIGSDASIFSMRGAWRDVTIGNMTVPTLASLHPQDLMAAPANKALAWQDLLVFKARLTSI
ncbi:uracil-DNA glycosylase [Neorhizobium sp. JUb45]|uniref:uracil-DNA glycosylase n=1 Tax=unclassified Neorhizobium TaxID=2629175 RepID=UPI0010498792|nr:uracil-DNA glycosylase [Neorhizobium sp. JUb45]TCR04320.1 DNA polymerase [Neorhizobium sp. JUb45]